MTNQIKSEFQAFRNEYTFGKQIGEGNLVGVSVENGVGLGKLVGLGTEH